MCVCDSWFFTWLDLEFLGDTLLGMSMRVSLSWDLPENEDLPWVWTASSTVNPSALNSLHQVLCPTQKKWKRSWYIAPQKYCGKWRMHFLYVFLFRSHDTHMAQNYGLKCVGTNTVSQPALHQSQPHKLSHNPQLSAASWRILSSQNVLHVGLFNDEEIKPRASGMLSKHYTNWATVLFFRKRKMKTDYKVWPGEVPYFCNPSA